MDFAELLKLYRTTLLDDVVPFWTRHAIDPAGGINSCITDEGKVVSRDKWSWSQWRAVWVFSKLYNRIEKRTEWLRILRACAVRISRFAGFCGPSRQAGNEHQR